MASSKKQLQLQTIFEFLTRNVNFSLIKFTNTSHPTLELLRKLLKKSGGEIKVVKNTILKKAINKLNIEKQSLTLRNLQKNLKDLKENTALLGCGTNWSQTLHAFYKFSQNEKTLSFKMGVLDNQLYNKEELIYIAQLPTKEELIRIISGSLKNPLLKLIYAMRSTINKFVYLIAIQTKIKN